MIEITIMCLNLLSNRIHQEIIIRQPNICVIAMSQFFTKIMKPSPILIWDRLSLFSTERFQLSRCISQSHKRCRITNRWSQSVRRVHQAPGSDGDQGLVPGEAWSLLLFENICIPIFYVNRSSKYDRLCQKHIM